MLLYGSRAGQRGHKVPAGRGAYAEMSTEPARLGRLELYRNAGKTLTLDLTEKDGSTR